MLGSLFFHDCLSEMVPFQHLSCPVVCVSQTAICRTSLLCSNHAGLPCPSYMAGLHTRTAPLQLRTYYCRLFMHVYIYNMAIFMNFPPSGVFSFELAVHGTKCGVVGNIFLRLVGLQHYLSGPDQDLLRTAGLERLRASLRPRCRLLGGWP